jgi:polyhydroxybutyrate depolymerase
MILVFPDSTVDDRGTGWNNFDPEPGEQYVDDAQFILDLIEHLAVTLNLDRQRIYAGGFSNGGQMVHYLAARTTNTFAAYAAVGSSIGGGKGGTNIVYTPPPLEARSVLIVNATNDCARPYWGGINDNGTPQPAAIEAAYHWISNNVCVESPVELTNRYVINSNDRPNFGNDCPNFNPPPNVWLTNSVIRTSWLGCTSSVEVTFVELTDGGHLWPDAADNVGFDANAEVIQFFLRHCRCDQPSQLVVPTVAGTYDLRLCDQGYWRKFRLAIPASYNAGLATPIVFTFHGGGQTMTEFSAAHPDLFTKCNTEGVLLVLPEATRHPQELDTLWGSKPFELVSDDRAFVTNLLGQLDAALNINLKKVYACGFSSGGRMSQWMAATWTNVLAAIAPVGAMIGWNDRDTGALVAPPTPLEAVPVFMVRGSMDAKQPFFGGTNAAGQFCFSAADGLAYWSNGSSCVGAPTITTVGVVTAWEYTACLGGTEVKLEGVAGLTHEWPESPSYNASVRVIDFLLRFTRP